MIASFAAHLWKERVLVGGSEGRWAGVYFYGLSGWIDMIRKRIAFFEIKGSIM